MPLIVDAGIGLPSHAAAAMELGYDAILLNTAVAKAGDPVAMAQAFALAIEAGRAAFLRRPDGSRATWPRPRRRCSARRILSMSAARSVSIRSSTAPPGSRGSPAPARG